MWNAKQITISIIILILSVFSLNAQKVRVSLFYHQLTEAFTVHCTKGEFNLKADGEALKAMKPGEIVYFELRGEYIRVTSSNNFLGNFKQIFLKDALLNGEFMIRTIRPFSNQRLYRGDLELSLENQAVKLINTIEFDQYLSGVVEAEAGPAAPGEFYKVQSILSRTWAVKHWDRHRDEGFNFCDDVHCQSFQGIADDNPTIIQEVLSTHGIVITDKHFQFITSAYHSNSGGETMKGSDLWPGENDYLLPIVDPFSTGQPNAGWTKDITTEAWNTYLVSRGVDTSVFSTDQTLIRQEHRIPYFIIGEDSLNMSEIREELKLKSAFFSMEMNPEDSLIQITGKGYGHGVGLSQEGAMEMARKGFSYEDIIRYYYFNVQIGSIDELPVSVIPLDFR